MYSFITGKLVSIEPTRAVLAVGGIGYEIEISLRTFEVIKELEEATLYVQLIVREDSHTLFGFHQSVEKDLFNKLISVSGIGPNTGRLVLSSMTAAEVVQAIREESDVAFKRVKGVGPKTAKRIILDLRDKLAGLPIAELAPNSSSASTPQNNTAKDEALSALVALGFKKSQVTKAVEKALHDSADGSVESLVKLALKAMTGGG